jgi:hypothetical protein
MLDHPRAERGQRGAMLDVLGVWFLRPTCGTTVQPSYLAHARLAGCLLWTMHGAFYVP